MRIAILPLLLLLAPLSCKLQAEQNAGLVAVDADAVAAYVRSCRKPNGAFGPADQEYSDAAWNYPAVATLLLLGEKVAETERVLQHGLSFPQGHIGHGHWLFFHQHKIRQLLGRPVEPEQRRVEVVHQGFTIRYYGSPLGIEPDLLYKAGSGAAPDPRDLAAKQLGYYNLASLYCLLEGLRASGREPANPQELADYVRRRQAPGGGFVDVRTAEGTPRDEEAHVAHTFYAVASLKLLGEQVPHTGQCTDYLHACQVASGQYRWHPAAEEKSNTADIYYTWAALHALDLLGHKPRLASECRGSINALQNADGGFGDRPGWRSRLYSTYYAVHALSLLGTSPKQAITVKQVRRPQIEPIPEGRFGIYQGLGKMPICQPEDLEGLAKRGLNLLALKSGNFDDAAKLLPVIRERKLPLDAILCPEAYPHRLTTWGGLVLDHVGNFTLDSRWNADERARWEAADQAGRRNPSWAGYRDQVLAPVRQLGGISYPEQDYELEHAYRAYDDGGYSAVLAGFNWSPRDFVRVFPWRERYVERLTPVADADAHGDLAKWSPQLDHTRHLYIARGPRYADFLEAATAKRVVCVIAEPEGVASGVTYYGPPAAVEYVRKRIADWRWWPAK